MSQATTAGSVTGSEKTSFRKLALAASVGSLIEWYDYFLYGIATATVFNVLFFPKLDPAVGTLSAFGVFALGFIARPIGGLVFGSYGDKFGRKWVLVVTMLMVGGGTFLIGCLPTYDSIGIWAPILLVVLRLVQGFGAGSEFASAGIMLAENAPPDRRGLWSSVAPMGVQTGLLIATGAFLLVSELPEDIFLSWGWRLPFFASAILVLIGLYIRTSLDESPVFSKLAAKKATVRMPVRDAILRYPRSFLTVIGTRAAEAGLGFLIIVFGVSYLNNNLHFSRSTTLLVSAAGTVATIIMLPIWASLSDRIGRRPVYAGAALFMLLWAFPFFWLVDTGQLPLVILAFVLATGIGLAGMIGPQTVYFAELFPPSTRNSGYALGRELGSLPSGTPAPLIAGALVLAMGGASWGVSVYIVVLVLITLVTLALAPETNANDVSSETAIKSVSEAKRSVTVYGMATFLGVLIGAVGAVTLYQIGVSQTWYLLGGLAIGLLIMWLVIVKARS